MSRTPTAAPVVELAPGDWVVLALFAAVLALGALWWVRSRRAEMTEADYA